MLHLAQAAVPTDLPELAADLYFGRGSMLVGLKDRVEVFGGWITLHSEPASGTFLEFESSLTASVRATHRWL
jgi:hypothetical protein